VLGLFHATERADGHWEIANPTWNQDKGPNTFPILTDGGLVLGQTGGGDYRTKAAFADVTLNITPRFAVGGGVRYSDNSRSSILHTYGDTQSGVAANGFTVGDNLNDEGDLSQVGSASNKSVTPRFTASFNIDDDRLLYFTASKGQRLPQSFPAPDFFDTSTDECINLARNLGLYDAAIKGTQSDTVWSYDLGLKSKWLDRRLLVNLSLYEVKWSALQLNVLLNQFDASCQQIIAANVGEVDVKGFELDTQYAPIDDLIFTAAVALADSGLADDVPGVTSSLGTPLRKGDEVTSAPRWTVNASAQYSFNMPFFQDEGARGFARIDWRYTGERFDESLGNRDALRADPVRSLYVASPYTLTDIRAGLGSGKWSGSVYVSNLFDKRAMYASHQSSWYPNQQIISVSQPRTIGFDLRVRL
jgi:iron complex outermembrane recepter protein